MNSVRAEEDRKMEEFQDWVNYVKPTHMNTEITMEIVNSLNEVIQDRSPEATMESIHQHVKKIKGSCSS